MFKFDEYPEIKKAYKEHNRLTRICDKAEKKIRPNDEESKLPCKEAFANLVAFNHNIFARLIYSTFNDKKPKLYNRVKDCILKWDKVFPDTFEKCDERLQIELLGLVLEIGYGVHWLPDEYYDDKPIGGGIPAPPTHTKPYKCW